MEKQREKEMKEQQKKIEREEKGMILEVVSDEKRLFIFLCRFMI